VRWRPPGLDGFRMANGVVSDQEFRLVPVNVSLIAATDADKEGSASRLA
jgi:hypothetical protein